MINVLIIIIISIAGAAGTFLLSQRIKDAVLASALLSLIVALVFYFDPNLLSLLPAKTPVAFFGASFVGMSSTDRFRKLWQMMLSGFIFGLIFINASKYFTGFGGGLGTPATLSVIITIGIVQASTFLKILKTSK